ncbi:MAG: glycosyltransferase family 9 protein [Nostoc sp. TH1S01]|nr:glycosyltransferase family 9 protein [Nostoc sp. TH1S01]
MNQKVKDCKSVLILRPDNLGDVVLFSGALRHIRNYFPNATISICVKEYVKNYIEHCPYIDYIYTWEKYAVPSSIFDYNARLRKYWLSKHWIGLFDRLYRKHLLKDLNADLLLVPTRSPKKGVYGEHTVISDIPAQIKIGIAGDYSNQNHQTDLKAERLYTQRLKLDQGLQDLHEFNVTAELLQFLGLNISVPDLWPEVWTMEEDRIWAEQRIPKSSKSIVLGLCPGATYTKKLYPIEQYKAIFESVNDETFTIILFGSKSERNLCEQIQQEIQNCKNVIKVLNLAGDSTIRQLIEGLRNCDVVLSADSASLHLSVSLRKPVVGIMGGGHYGRFYPWGDPRIHRVVNKPMDCYWCNWRCRFPSVRCIEEIDPTQIAFELQSLIKELYRAKKI